MADKKNEIVNVCGDAHFEEHTQVDRLTVAHFWADWADQCRQMDEIFKILSSDEALSGKRVSFLRVEAEKEPELSIKHKVAAVPTVLFFTSGKLLDRIEGANASEVSKKTKELVDKLEFESKLCTGSVEEKKKSLEEKINALISSSPCMLFMRGNPEKPECDSSREIVQILSDLNVQYGYFNILSNNEIKQGLEEHKCITYPQLYLKGELIGSHDVIKELMESGKLQTMLPKKRNLEERLKYLINQAKVMVFMKGSKSQPKCGFSRQMMEILAEAVPSMEFKTFDIFEDEEVRQGLKKFSDWPTYPQVYVNGELIGGLDIIKELKENGELQSALKGELQ